MTQQDRENKNQDLESTPAGRSVGDQHDLANKYLSDALRLGFIVLKIIMVVLVIAFLASGFKTIGSDEKGLLLRFGRIKPVGPEGVLGPGPHWVLPYPIDEVIRIPVTTKVNLPVDSFWYPETLPLIPGRPPGVPQALNPVRDGYCITRSETQGQAVPGSSAGDYNIVHSRWQLTYRIDDPTDFFRNTYVEDPKPGEIYFSVLKRSITPFLKSVFEDAVVTALVNYSIDEAIRSQDRIPRHVQRLVQERLEAIESGIRIESVQLTGVSWPRQVNEAFLASIRASQESQKAISEARGYFDNTLSETAGPLAQELHAALFDDSINEQEKETLWTQLAGRAQEIIAEAKAYRTKVVESAKANAGYLRAILPEYRKRPELVLQEIYLGTMESIFGNANEVFLIQPTEGAKGTELRVHLNRDPALKPRSEKKQ